MKRPSLRRQHGLGFTLVELLVVIAIIAILASVITVAAGNAIRAAKRAKANSTCAQIQTAVQSYYTEYGVYPVVGTVATDDYYDGVTGGAKWGNLTLALCGNIDPYNGSTGTTSTVPNTRGIAYLAPTRSDLDSVNHTFVNPFASASNPVATTAVPAPYFSMVVDTDYSGVAGDTGTPGAAGPLIDFTNTTTLTPLGHGVPGGVAVQCSCDQPLTGANSHPNFWVHTY
jgi:prepilin-type N-terminal cleavage/methylation domain-containing protein